MQNNEVDIEDLRRAVTLLRERTKLAQADIARQQSEVLYGDNG